MAKKSLLKRKERVISLTFVSPLFIGYILFTLVPFVVAIIYSLVDYMPLYGRVSPLSFDVYKSLFKADLTTVGFGDAIVNTLIMMLSIPINLVIGLIFSGFITKKGFKSCNFKKLI